MVKGTGSGLVRGLSYIQVSIWVAIGIIMESVEWGLGEGFPDVVGIHVFDGCLDGEEE